MRFKKRSHLCNIKVQSETERVDIEATTNIQKTQPRQLVKVTTRNNRFSKQPSIGIRCHLGLSQLERRNQCQALELQKIGCFSCQRLMQLIIFKLKVMFIYCFENPRALKNFLKFCFLYSINGTTKPGHLFTNGLLNLLSIVLRYTAQEKKKNHSLQNTTAY